MKKGLPAKFLFIPGGIIFLIIVWTISPQFLPNEAEYKKDQAYLAEVMNGKLPETPSPEVKLPVKGYIIAGGAGTCMVDAAAGIANFYEPDIDFDTFIFYANPTLIMAKRDKGIVNYKKSHSHKTKKRLEIKRLMLEAKAKKRSHR